MGLSVCEWAWGLADLDQVRVAVEAEGLAARGRDALRSPCGFVEESDCGVTYGFDAGETIGDLGAKLGISGIVIIGWSEGDLDVMFFGDAGNVGAGRLEIGRDDDGSDEAEIDDVAGERGIVAIAEGGEDVGFGQHVVVPPPPSILRKVFDSGCLGLDFWCA